MYHVGVTASSTSITPVQEYMLLWRLADVIRQYKLVTLHHGDCVEGDAKAVRIARHLCMRIHCHPPTNSYKRAFTQYDDISPEKDFLVRNRDIVDESSVLFVLPDTMYERIRSGTWATYRYAARSGKPTVIIFPDGTIKRTPDE